MTIKEMCDKIAQKLNDEGIQIKNLKTGMIVKTGDDVFNFSSTGELFHIWQWYYALFPEQSE